MASVWLIVYLLAAVGALVQAFLMVLQSWENRRFARNRMRELHAPQPKGEAVIFAPCKGVDVGLEQNLGTLMTQDYDNYSVTFIVGAEHDPACPLIRRVMAQYPRVRSRLVVAGDATDSGQKVHNLRVATADLPPSVDYLVFVDSDARPRPQWLRSLLARLDRPQVGAATGYRWFIPARRGFANHLLYAINCATALFLGHGGRNLVWGGSWAIRRPLFDELGVRAAWRGTISDDLVVSSLLRSQDLKVLFEPACMVMSPIDHRLPDAYRFIRRQYLLARCHVRHLWLLLLLTSCFVQGVWAATAALFAWGWFGGPVAPIVPALVGLGLYGLQVARSALRQDLGRTYFPHMADALQAARRFDLWAGPIVNFAQWLGVLTSLVGRQMTWRGIRYELGPRGQVRRMDLPSRVPLPHIGDPVPTADRARAVLRSRDSR